MDLECENLAEEMGSMLLYSQASTGGPISNPTQWLRAGNLGTDRLVSVSHILLPPNHSILLTLETDLSTLLGFLVFWLSLGFG